MATQQHIIFIKYTFFFHNSFQSTQFTPLSTLFYTINATQETHFQNKVPYKATHLAWKYECLVTKSYFCYIYNNKSDIHIHIILSWLLIMSGLWMWIESVAVIKCVRC